MGIARLQRVLMELSAEIIRLLIGGSVITYYGINVLLLEVL